MSLNERELDDAIVDLVLESYKDRVRGAGCAKATMWLSSNFCDEPHRDGVTRLMKDAGRVFFPLGISIVASLEVGERNDARSSSRLTFNVLSVELPALEMLLSDPDDRRVVRRLLIQGRENVLSFLRKLSARLAQSRS